MGRAAKARRRRLSQHFARLHANVERPGARALRGFFRSLTADVLRLAERSGSAILHVEEVFQPVAWQVSFSASLRPTWSRAIHTGAEFEADWIEERSPRRQSLSSMVAQDLEATTPTDSGGEFAELPSVHVELPRDTLRKIQEFLKSRTVGVWANVGKSTKRAIEGALARSIELGESHGEMVARLRHVLTRHGEVALRRIARTETTASMNFGQQAVRDMHGIAEKEWIATIDSLVRGASPGDRFNHLAADGQITRNGGVFVVSGEQLHHPGDGSMGASAGNIINCRCTAVAHIDTTKRPDLGGGRRGPKRPEGKKMMTPVEDVISEVVDALL